MHGHGSSSGHDGPRLVVAPDVHRRRWAILGVLSLSLLITALDHTIMNVALPKMVVDLGASTSQMQWIVDSYTVVFAGLLLAAGALGDRFGRKGALQAGLATFLGGSLLAAMSSSADGIIAARAVMGAGGALIMPATLSILTNAFSDPRERAKAIGAWAGVSGIGVALGPIAGGYLLEHFSWSSVFWLNVPVVIIALAIGHSILPRSKGQDGRPLDPVGALLSVAALTSVVYSIIEAPAEGWGSGSTFVRVAVSMVLVAAFITWEIRHPAPMLDMRFFSNPRFSAASLSITFAFFAMAGAIFMVTQYLQFVLAYSPLRAGMGILPVAAAIAVAGPLSAHVTQHIGGRATIVTGLALVSVGLVVQATLTGSTYLPIAIGQTLFGLGLGLAMAPATDSIMGSLPHDRAGVGSAVNDTTREVGSALGVAVIGSIAGSVYADHVGGRVDQLALPAPMAAAVKNNVGAAMHAATGLEPGAASELMRTARDGFVEAMHVGMWIGAGVAMIGAVIAVTKLPGRSHQETHQAHQAHHAHQAHTPIPSEGHHPAISGAAH